MQIRLGYDIVTRQPAPTPMILLLHARPDYGEKFVTPDDIHTDPNIPLHEYIDTFGNRCTRLLAPAGTLRIHTEAFLNAIETNDPVVLDAVQHRIEELPDECLQFLLASRYCEVDKIAKFAWETFGHTAPGWGRVQAVSDFVHKYVTFGYQYARPTKTALDVLEEKNGVCRDYQHLAVTLCRALGVPARYATGYLGEIRVAEPLPGAMDFSAWFQVFLSGQWWNFDARFNVPRAGRTLMAVGRDAADVALITTFGVHELDKFEVIAEEHIPA